MTLRGAELIAKADSIVYDYLASPDFLSLAKPQAELVYAGKIGSHHAMPQEEISRLLVTLGKSGKIVVRLKGGDPYVFGRGGEEALALFNEGVPFEVVPGVSSAVAAPAAAGIPLTHRDLSSQVCIMTGHEKPGKESSAHDFAALAKMGTLSIVMGAKNLKTIADSLIKAGKPPSTPAAMIEWGHTPRQRAVSAPLSELSAAAEREGLGPPSVLVVGEVVRLRESLSWYERRPLFGRKILVTRTRTQASELSKLLTELGAEAIEKPVIEIKPLEPEKALAGAFQKLARYSWLILTSPNGASIFMEALLGLGFDSRSLGGLKIAAIGPGTAQALGRFGLKPDLLPRAFVAEGLVAAFEGLNEKDKGLCLLPRAEAARDALPEGLFKLGYEVEAVPIYRAVKASWGDSNFSKELLASPPDLTTLTSSSTAEGLADLIEPQCRHLLPVASIGPVTTSAAKSLGFFVAVESPASTIPALAGAIFSSLSGKGA
jgi:uroporphyrinogen III methyltransferase/synthase